MWLICNMHNHNSYNYYKLGACPLNSSLKQKMYTKLLATAGDNEIVKLWVHYTRLALTL